MVFGCDGEREKQTSGPAPDMVPFLFRFNSLGRIRLSPIPFLTRTVKSRIPARFPQSWRKVYIDCFKNRALSSGNFLSELSNTIHSDRFSAPK